MRAPVLSAPGSQRPGNASLDGRECVATNPPLTALPLHSAGREHQSTVHPVLSVSSALQALEVCKGAVVAVAHGGVPGGSSLAGPHRPGLVRGLALSLHRIPDPDMTNMVLAVPINHELAQIRHCSLMIGECVVVRFVDRPELMNKSQQN